MNSRTLLYTISTIAIVAMVFVFINMVLAPPVTSNEIIITVGDNDWSLGNDPIFYGKSYWSTYSDSSHDETIQRSETIKMYYCIYWGALTVDKETMSWETATGNFSSKSLAHNDLLTRWQDSGSVFKFKHEETYFKVTFSIPKTENGDYKYTNITQAWEKGELYQTIELW